MTVGFFRVVCAVLPGLFMVLNARDVFYADLSELRPTQIRYSSENVKDKVKKAIKQGATVKNFLYFKYNNGTSIFDVNDAVPVIKTPEGLFLCDGHHSVLASKEVGATTMPVFIADKYNFNVKNNPIFWTWASQKNYAYLRDLDGKNKYPADFESLTDDPVRYFVALAARKFEKSAQFSDSTGADYPLWVKIGKDVPFVEFRVADLLYEAGFKFVYGDEQDKKLFEQKIEMARGMLEQRLSLLTKVHPLKKLKFLPKKEFYKESSAIKEWLKNTSNGVFA
ncbi:TPA: hypothetical protein DDZ86_01805 [Candidatus Dependentiae bacterium]|nr:MAG: hypothetical protein UW09_C0001G0276 [candidate division TM6 bacterium GW2011_GWF2_43_87]HBL98359.1 hypothetical protein [Candidatus Dependentiae bacterium]